MGVAAGRPQALQEGAVAGHSAEAAADGVVEQRLLRRRLPLQPDGRDGREGAPRGSTMLAASEGVQKNNQSQAAPDDAMSFLEKKFRDWSSYLRGSCLMSLAPRK